MEQQRRCTKCKKLKDISEFPRDKYMLDDLHVHCRECHNENARVWRTKNPGKYYDTQREWGKKNPQAKQAHLSVRRAIKDGSITKPGACQVNDGTCSGALQAHHRNGYDAQHALDVVWLCQSHHEREHRREKEQTND